MYRKDRQNEFYTTLAKKEGFPARSVYKLKEIDEKYRIIKEGNRVLDLGCAPGSWLLYISQKVGDKGKVIGIDIEETKIPQKANIVFIKRSVFDLKGPEVDEAKASSSPSPAAAGLVFKDKVEEDKSFSSPFAAARVGEVRQKRAQKETKIFTGKIALAFEVGKLIAKKALKKKIEKVVFDRGGYAFHGRVKTIAEGAREGGLKF